MKLKTNEELAEVIDELSSEDKDTINDIIGNATPSLDFTQTTNHKIAANTMFRYCDGEIDSVNGYMNNYELQSTSRPSPPPGSGGLWALIISIVSK